jgi:hypothetical protein
MITGEQLVPDVSVTQRLLGTAAGRGSRPALAGSEEVGDRTYGGLASTIQAAAAGLAWRGLRPRDVVGVLVPDAVCSVLADGLTVADMAGQLADCGARMLITARPLAAVALAAADRSWVRQVISFGEAPGAIPFDALLAAGTLRPAPGRRTDLALLPYTRLGDGQLCPAGLTQHELAADLCALTSRICGTDVVIAAPPSGDGRAYATLLDRALLSGATVVAAPAGRLAETAAAWQGTVAVVPQCADVSGSASLRVLAVAS